MKIMRLLAFASILYLFSCDAVDQYREEKRFDYYRRLHEGFVFIMQDDTTCDNRIKRLQNISKEFGRNIDRSIKHDVMRQGKLSAEFYSLYLKGHYKEAYSMGINSLPFMVESLYKHDIEVKLALLAVNLGCFAEFERKTKFWESYSVDNVKSNINYTISNPCNNHFQTEVLLDWFATYESTISAKDK